jgi:FkbM family methyltransferase
MSGRLLNKMKSAARRSLHSTPKLDPFVLSRTNVCGLELVLMTHQTDRVIGEWVRGKKYWSAQDLAEYQHLMAHARSSRLIVDVGSNIGIVSILMSKVAPQARIFAFEPDPTNFAIAQINYNLNRCKNVFGINAAISNRTGTIALHRSSENWGDHRTYLPGQAELEKEFSSAAERALAIDPALFFAHAGEKHDIEPIDFLKIDTQGSEIKILSAFHPFLGKGAVISLEFSPHHLMAGGTTESDISRALGSADLIELIAPPDEAHTDWHVKQTSHDELIQFFRTGPLGYKAVGYRDILLRWSPMV